MKILVINSGSSTIKYQLFDDGESSTCSQGDRGAPGRGRLLHQSADASRCLPPRCRYTPITKPSSCMVEGFCGIPSTGHSVTPTRSTRSVIARARADAFVIISRSPPKSSPSWRSACPWRRSTTRRTLMVSARAQKLLPNVPHVAVFDTSFHQTMPRQSLPLHNPARVLHPT